uniref:Cytochrome f n=1 Tax=Cyanidium sp. THAL103 TaxID=3027999 RepID=A0A9Y1MXT7_9RHOD|nr:cytochrome f [Cyanidium sp. THAL103]
MIYFKIKKFNNILVNSCLISLYFISYLNPLNAYPIYAQQAYENPREATGRIVCANCHLAQKSVNIEAPHSVLPNSIFTVSIKIPIDHEKKQILSNGKQGDLNVGAVLILPNEFKLAPKDKLNKELKEKTKDLYFNQYNQQSENIIVIGPIAGKQHEEIIFPIISPDPSINKKVNFVKYPIYVGGNRGRGQLYPSGEKSNNNALIASESGQIIKIETLNEGGYNLIIKTKNDQIKNQIIPNGLSLKVNENQIVNFGEVLTNDPNVGGFGQNETEIVLQNPKRVIGFLIFSAFIFLSQIFFVFKKKQFEKVQAKQMLF